MKNILLGFSLLEEVYSMIKLRDSLLPNFDDGNKSDCHFLWCEEILYNDPLRAGDLVDPKLANTLSFLGSTCQILAPMLNH